MKIDYLRDAFDSFKTELLNRVFEGELNNAFYVYPMRTDSEWSDDAWRLYAQITCGNSKFVDRVLQKNTRFTGGNRRSYFAEVELREVPDFAAKDLFIDPNTGVETPWETGDRDHVMISDMETLLPEKSSRLLAVYQHKFPSCPDGGLSSYQYVENVITRIQSRGFKGGAYYGGMVSMIFISRDASRIQKAMDSLAPFASPLDKTRLIRPRLPEVADVG